MLSRIRKSPSSAARKRFSAEVDLFAPQAKQYKLYRPTYPVDLVSKFLNTARYKKARKIIDVGCGASFYFFLFSSRSLTFR